MCKRRESREVSGLGEKAETERAKRTRIERGGSEEIMECAVTGTATVPRAATRQQERRSEGGGERREGGRVCVHANRGKGSMGEEARTNEVGQED